MGLVTAARALLQDLAATIFFVLLYALTRNLTLSVSLAIALAAVQIGWRLWRRRRVETMQWVSVIAVAASGTATLITHNPTFVMLKPTLIYVFVGCAMLQRGWLVRYVPPHAMEYVPDLVIASGYVWASLMFFSAALNLVLATQTGLLVWGSVMAAWDTGSKIALFGLQYAYMRFVGRRRYLAHNLAHTVAAAT
jgi:intracellular septation protein